MVWKIQRKRVNLRFFFAVSKKTCISNTSHALNFNINLFLHFGHILFTTNTNNV